MKDDEVEMEIFRSGNYGAKGSYTGADLQQIVDDYRPDLLEAPLTFDHAQTGPAYGWVSRLRREGDRLVAALKGVPDAVRDLVRSGAYKRRSIELFQKFPQTGRPYLRAVSLLGAATPEVKGLRNICFEAAPDCEALQLGDDSSADEAASAAHLADLKQQVLQARLTAMFSDLRADGYCLPQRDAVALRQLFATADSAEAAVQFDDGPGVPVLDWLSGFLRQGLLRLPAASALVPAASAQDESLRFSQFSTRTDPTSLHLHQRVLIVQGENPGMSYRDALAEASRQR